MKWIVNKDEALELHRGGVCVGGIWRSAWKTGERHVPSKAVMDTLAMVGAMSGVSLPLGPRDVLEHGFLAAAWHPYRSLGRFLTVKEAKMAVEAMYGVLR